jgi:hypothetical protein
MKLNVKSWHLSDLNEGDVFRILNDFLDFGLRQMTPAFSEIRKTLRALGIRLHSHCWAETISQ